MGEEESTEYNLFVIAMSAATVPILILPLALSNAWKYRYIYTVIMGYASATVAFILSITIVA